jgi:hypothetical protein
VGRRRGFAAVTAQVDSLSSIQAIEVVPPTLTGAGDIGACPLPGAAATARILDTIPGRIFTAGDNVYPDGTVAEWRDCWTPTWGRHRKRTWPTIGNHDFNTDSARAYHDYWGPAISNGGRGYYSRNVGTWHLVMLNSEIDVSAKSAQVAWLKKDLEQASASTCTLAIWHRPRFSSSSTEDSDPRMKPLWDVLYSFNADIVLNGHAHDYERFAKQDPRGVADAAGIRAFVVGTGGAQLYPIGVIAANSEVRQAATHGVLRLVLLEDRYEWQFIGVASDPAFSDRGEDRCHRADR